MIIERKHDEEEQGKIRDLMNEGTAWLQRFDQALDNATSHDVEFGSFPKKLASISPDNLSTMSYEEKKKLVRAIVGQKLLIMTVGLQEEISGRYTTDRVQVFLHALDASMNQELTSQQLKDVLYDMRHSYTDGETELPDDFQD